MGTTFKTIGTNTQVMTALKINIPEVSAEIVLSCSAIFAAAMTKDKVEVNKMLKQSSF